MSNPVHVLLFKNYLSITYKLYQQHTYLFRKFYFSAFKKPCLNKLFYGVFLYFEHTLRQRPISIPLEKVRKLSALAKFSEKLNDMSFHD